MALTALFFVSASGMFPVGNAPFAYLLYLLLLHRSGYHFSAHVPVMRLLYGTGSALCAQERGRYAAEADAPALPFEPGDLAVEYDGTYDWTLVFERAVELILEEQRWVMTKLEGMSRRREFAIFVVLSVIGLGINNGCMWAGVEFLGIHYLIVKIGATFIVMVWNFVTRKIFLDAGDAPGEILSDIE